MQTFSEFTPETKLACRPLGGIENDGPKVENDWIIYDAGPRKVVRNKYE